MPEPPDDGQLGRVRVAIGAPHDYLVVPVPRGDEMVGDAGVAQHGHGGVPGGVQADCRHPRGDTVLSPGVGPNLWPKGLASGAHREVAALRLLASEGFEMRVPHRADCFSEVVGKRERAGASRGLGLTDDAAPIDVLMDRVRTHAAQAGVPATALMRQWILDRLDSASTDVVVSVADLEQFIASRAHMIAS
jgi:hypothetical protein